MGGGGICELAQGEKWENWSISPSWILNIYVQAQRRKEERRKKKRKSVFSTPVFVFVTQIDFCYLAQLQTLGTSV